MIACILPCEYFCDGETAVCLIKGDEQYYEKYKKSIVFAQIHGHINIDFRWLSQSNKHINEYIQEPSITIDKIQKPNKDPIISSSSNYSSYCIFSTSRIPLSSNNIFNNGNFLEFEIPTNILPSFRGLCATINYYVTLSIQHPMIKETIDFPITICSSGLNSIPYQIKYSSLVGYAASQLPKELFFSANNIDYHDNNNIYTSTSLYTSSSLSSSLSQNNNNIDNNEDSIHSNEILTTYNPTYQDLSKTYMISDKEHICSIKINTLNLIAGDDAYIYLDFTNNIQQCYAVRSVVIQCEQRSDGTRIQEKVIIRTVRTSINAEYLNLSIRIPEETQCSFETPLFHVSYKINIEFCLEENNNSNNNTTSSSNSNKGLFENAFSFSLPINIYVNQQHHTYSNNIILNSSYNIRIHNDINSYYTSNHYIQQRALLCLESDIISNPIHIK